MDPVTAIGLASAIATFVSIGTKVAKTIGELSEAGDIPEVFREIKTRLPFITSIVDRTHRATTDLSPEANESFEEVIAQCLEQVNQLDEILKKVEILKGDSRLKKTVKAGVSLCEEGRVQRIATALRDNVQLLTFLNFTPVEKGRPKIERMPSEPPSFYTSATGLFLVPFSRDAQFVGRESQLRSVDSSFMSQHRVAISGIGGVGKSQRLAAATWLYGRLRYYEARSSSDMDAAAEILRKALSISKN